MSEAKKYLLIDASNANQISKLLSANENLASQRLLPPLTREITNLDKTMAEIAKDQTLTIDERVDRYEKNLSNYLNLRSLSNRPALPQPELQPKLNPENTVSNDNVENHIIGIPKPYKNKAKLLYAYLGRLPISVSELGEVTINGKSIKNSNISDLLNASVNARWGDKYTSGWNQFQEFMKDNNVPMSLLSKNVASTINSNDSKPSPQTPFSTPADSYKTPKSSRKRQSKYSRQSPLRSTPTGWSIG